ncbi:MAG: nucleoside monophosphate kinase [Alphaproteobacteria bacterium]|nr:nucleoside monophosphate kinase [Alphaproteobacteria bacterium]MBN2780227.1 nucleoside monophosphate kinase [Alphaproteobacteria bacterium]
MKLYIFSGSLASGKGTQASLITKFLPNAVHLSTGEIFRAEIEAGTEIGKKAKALIDVGTLVPDDSTNAIVVSFLEALDPTSNVLLDGYPRNEAQVAFLEQYVQEKNHTIEKVILLDLDESVVKKRVLGRFECRHCHVMYNDFFKPTKREGVCDVCGSKEFYRRPSDTEKTIEKRLALYRNTIVKALSFYENKDNFVRIDANKSPSEVFKEIKEKVFKNSEIKGNSDKN